VNWSEVIGKVDAFGLPASREIIPGRRSRGIKLRTWFKGEGRVVSFITCLRSNTDDYIILLGLGRRAFAASDKKRV
jgi:hypothetical protein